MPRPPSAQRGSGRLIWLPELPSQAAGEEPADEGGGRAADDDGNEAEGLAADHEVHADAEHGTADEASGDAGGDAEPDDVAAGDHGLDM